MTVAEALTRTQALRPHAIDRAALTQHLSVLDGRIRCEIFGENAAGLAPLDEETVLAAPHPFDTVYEQYLAAKVDAACGEYERYTGEMAAFNETFAALAAYHVRTRAPRRTRLRFFGGERT